MNRHTPTGMLRLRRGDIGPARILAVLALAAFASPALAQNADAWVPAKGHGTMSIAYQHLFVRYHTFADGTKDVPGTIRNRDLFFDFDYGVTDRLALTVGAAYKSDKYEFRKGSHDPGTLDDDHGQQFIDDGRYHGSWQDWSIALRYQWLDKPFLVTPFIAYGRPLRDYSPRRGQWGSVIGVQPNGLQVFAPNGRAFRFPAWTIRRLLQGAIVNRGIYRGIRG